MRQSSCQQKALGELRRPKHNSRAWKTNSAVMDARIPHLSCHWATATKTHLSRARARKPRLDLLSQREALRTLLDEEEGDVPAGAACACIDLRHCSLVPSIEGHGGIGGMLCLPIRRPQQGRRRQSLSHQRCHL